MASGETTRGQVAKTMAGVTDVEIKATVPSHQVDVALEHYRLSLDGGERYIYFYDTPELEGFEQGIIARSRRIVGGQHDSTIKFRPVEPSMIPALWQKYSGFKIEADASDKGVVKSASLTMPVAKGLIKRVAAGKNPVSDLFTQEQLLFLFSLANKRINYERAVVLGPVRAWRWKYVDEGLPWPITGELWRRDDGERLFEVSIKVPVAQAAAATAGFMAFLAEVGAERDTGQQAKTRWTLEYEARKHCPVPDPDAAEKAEAALSPSATPG
ncbi:MAG: hypothetical protein U0790_03065 [Isosphaeraceae bacterium]